MDIGKHKRFWTILTSKDFIIHIRYCCMYVHDEVYYAYNALYKRWGYLKIILVTEVTIIISLLLSFYCRKLLKIVSGPELQCQQVKNQTIALGCNTGA